MIIVKRTKKIKYINKKTTKQLNKNSTSIAIDDTCIDIVELTKCDIGNFAY